MYATTFMAPTLYRDLFNHFPDAAGHPSRLGDQRRNSEGLHRQPLLQLDRLRVLHQHGHQVGRCHIFILFVFVCCVLRFRPTARCHIVVACNISPLTIRKDPLQSNILFVFCLMGKGKFFSGFSNQLNMIKQAMWLCFMGCEYRRYRLTTSHTVRISVK